MNLRTTADLRRILSETIEQVRDNKIGAEKATAVAQLCACIVRSADLDLKAMRYTQRYNGQISALGEGTTLIGEVTQ
jgi:hypothetical protein